MGNPVKCIVEDQSLTETGLYKNRYTSRAKQLYEVVCGKYETEAQIKKSQEVI